MHLSFSSCTPPLNVRLKYLLWFAFYTKNVDGINPFTNRSLQHFDMILRLAAADIAASNGNKPLQQPSVSRTTFFLKAFFCHPAMSGNIALMSIQLISMYCIQELETLLVTIATLCLD